MSQQEAKDFVALANRKAIGFFWAYEVSPGVWDWKAIA